MTRSCLLVVVVTAVIVMAGDGPRSAQGPGPVRPGIETFLADVPAAVRGKRVGLITNHSGIDRERRTDIDLIARHKDLKLVALLAPEHGIRGTADAGATIEDEKDPKTGVPIFSLYKSEDRGPTDEMLRDVDVLVYDLRGHGESPVKWSKRSRRRPSTIRWPSPASPRMRMPWRSQPTAATAR